METWTSLSLSISFVSSYEMCMIAYILKAPVEHLKLPFAEVCLSF